MAAVDWLQAALRFLAEGLAGLSAWTHPLAGLALVSAAAGAGMLWVFGRASDQRAIARTKKRMQAYLLESRLYGDDLGLLFRAQGKLVAANLRYLALMLKPAVVLIAPTAVLLYHLDAVYGVAAAPPGEAVVVTVRVDGPIDAAAEPPAIAAPEGVAVETPAVRVAETGEFSWRLRAGREVRGDLVFDWRGERWTKSFDAGAGPRYVSPWRDGSWWGRIAAPGEPALRAEGVEAVEIRYPEARVEAFGFALHWLVWFLLISLAAGFALRGAFGVAI